jgi:RNA polymerase sigma factor (sigma-70 family)
VTFQSPAASVLVRSERGARKTGVEEGRAAAVTAAERPWDVTQEAALVAQARDDPQAFAPLYARYLDPVYRYCYRRLGGREAAEDATSIVFAKALTALPRYRDGSFGGWLFAIAHNVVTDTYRRRRPEAPLVAAGDPVDRDPTPEEAALAADARQTVDTLLSSLPTDQRRVLELRLAGLTGAEIADALGRSVAAIKMLQLRAMTRLRTDLGASRGTKETDDDDGV